MLEKNLGIQIKAFAYPYGLHNQTVRDVVKQAGYEAAFTVWGRRIAYRADPMMICHRVHKAEGRWAMWIPTVRP